MIRYIRGGPLLLAAALVTLGAGAATAFTELHPGQEFEVPLPVFAPIAPADMSERDVVLTASMSDLYGGRWHAQGYNVSTGKPRWLYGSGPQVIATISDATTLELGARRVLDEMGATLGVDAQDLRLGPTPSIGGKWAAHFEQTYHGIDVWQARTSVVFGESGRLLVVGSEFRRGIDIDPQPAYGANDAIDLARADLPFPTTVDDSRGAPQLLVLPVPVSPSEERFHLVWRVRVSSEDPLGTWVTHVDAHDGSIVWRYNDVRFEYGGSTASDVQEDTYCLGSAVQAMPYLRLTIDGIVTVFADSDGDWTADGTGGPGEVTADLYSPFVDLNRVPGDEEAEFSGTAMEGEPLLVVFDAGNSRQDERDVFDGVNDLHDFFESIDPGFAYANQMIEAFVGHTGGICPGNAWFSPVEGTINFCEAGGAYANTGEIQGVVHHEFGHGVNQFILGWQGTTGMGEGNSDVLTILMTQESIIGRGFFQDDCVSGIRNADNTLRYPEDVIGQQIHYAGQVIAGFNWDAMVLMQGVVGQDEGTFIAARNWHQGRVLLQPTTMPAQVFATFVADDDDDNLDNGTPHHPYYEQAALNHGFTPPAITVGVLISHEPLNDTTDSGPFALRASIVSTEAALDPEQLRLFWRGGGSWNEVPLTDLGGDLFEGTVPEQGGGDVEYYFTAGDVLGNEAKLPALAPDFLFGFLVAAEIDPVETDGDWIAGAPDDDATTGMWVRVDPVGTIAQPENDHTVDGTDCWVTGQHQAGQSDGFSDIDGGKTTLTSAVYDLASFDQVDLRYWKWYTNDRGASPGNDFWVVEVSNDAGATWSELENTQESTSGWEAFTFDVDDLFTTPGQVQLRFVAADEGAGSLVEAAIDDVAIIASSAVTGIDDGDLQVAMAPQLAQNVPNPFNPATEISFTLPRAGAASLKVYDVQGALVRVLLDGQFEAGPQRIIWDGTGSDDRPVSSGVYLYRLETPDGTLGKRMLLIK